MTGEDGADIFYFDFSNNGYIDRIADFDASEGDVIQVEADAFGDSIDRFAYNSGTLSAIVNVPLSDGTYAESNIGFATLPYTTFDVSNVVIV